MATRLVAAHSRARQQIARESQRQVRRAFETASEARFIAEVIAIEDAAIAATVAEQDAYLATFLQAHGVPASPQGLDPSAYRRPVDPAEQWERPHKHVRMKLADGWAAPEALRFGRQMAERMQATDLQYAARTSSRDWMVNEGGSDGSRRVTRGLDPCGLCVAAADQLYYVEDLQPIHDNCNCEVVPVSTSRRYGLTGGQYDDVLAQTGGDTSREALSRVRLGDGQVEPFAVAEHGELGPYLYDPNHAPPLLSAA